MLVLKYRRSLSGWAPIERVGVCGRALFRFPDFFLRSRRDPEAVLKASHTMVSFHCLTVHLHFTWISDDHSIGLHTTQFVALGSA
jgi:hypothetical protein